MARKSRKPPSAGKTAAPATRKATPTARKAAPVAKKAVPAAKTAAPAIATRVARRGPASPAAAPPLPYDRQLAQAARSLAVPIWQVLNGIILAAALIGLLVGLWLLRPTPTFSADEIATGSPFDVRFRVVNDSGFATLANLEISCVLASLRGSGLGDTAVAATNLVFATPGVDRLAPGEQATFTCPFHAGIPQVRRDDPGAAQRAEIYFHARYDLPPLPGWLPVTANSARFTLDTRRLPPRWTSKAGK